jgi:hypothetical protein
MRIGLAVASCILWTASLAWAGEPELFDPDQPFEQAFSMNVLRSLLNEALDRLEDHVEISGHLTPDGKTSDRRGHLRFKFYPEGKSQSDRHFTAEGGFRLAPDDTVQDFSFRFRNPGKPARNSSPQSGDIL